MELSKVADLQLKFAQLTQVGQSGQSNGAASTVASELLAPVSKRLAQQAESTNVKLSAYGQIKSGFGSAQTAAASLAHTAMSKAAGSADLTKAAQAFVNAYNQANQAVTTAVKGSGTQPGTLAADVRAKRAASDLAQTVTGGRGPADLKQAGITQNKDGSLALDMKALEQSLQANSAETRNALARLGQQVDAGVGRELASRGNVGASVSSLTSRSQALSAQQAALQQQAADLQNTPDRRNTVLSYAAASGLAAYQKLLG